jgi:hypothetical protein
MRKVLICNVLTDKILNNVYKHANNPTRIFSLKWCLEYNKLSHSSLPFTVNTRVSQRDVVSLGWPIAPSYMSNRLERKRQNTGGCGLSLALNSCAYRAQLNFKLTLYIVSMSICIQKLSSIHQHKVSRKLHGSDIYHARYLWIYLLFNFHLHMSISRAGLSVYL